MSQDNNYAITVKEELKDKLEEYIFFHNIHQKGSQFRCPNAEAHNNGDKKPSAHYSKQVWNCLACSAKGDIFHFAGYLEGLPSDTKEELYGITIPHIAEELKFPIDYEKYEEAMLSMNFKNIAQIRRMREKNKKELEQILEVINKKKNWKKLNGEFNRHYPDKLKEEITDTFGVFFPDTGDFNFLEKSNIFNDKMVIKSKNLVFPIHDKYNNLVYFCARRPISEEPKYCYTSKPDNNDHPPSLFNVFKAKKYINISKKIFLFEAQFDCMVAFCSGLKESISIGTTTPVEILLQILEKTNAKEIVLILDPDKAGIDSTVKYYTALSEEGYVVNCVELPIDKDADEVIVEHGIEYFKDVANQKTVIEYAIIKDYKDIGNMNLTVTSRYLEAIQLIVTYCKSAAIASQYSQLLVTKFNFKEIKDVATDIATAYNTKKNPLVSKLNSVIETTTRDILIEPDIEKKVKLVTELSININKTFNKYNASLGEESAKSLRHILNTFNDTTSTRIKTGFHSLDNVFKFSTKCLYVLSAKPSHLKSAFLKAVAKNIADNSTNENPACVIHISTDDTPNDTFRGILSNMTNIDSDLLEDKKEMEELSETLKNRINKAKDLFVYWWQNNIYTLEGVNIIKSVEDIYRLIIQKRNVIGPDIPIILFVDSFANIPSVSGEVKEKRLVVESSITRLKEIAEDTNSCMVTLVEIKKTDSVRIKVEELKETGAFEYRAQGILLFHNDYKHNEKTGLYHLDESGNRLPILEIRIPKYKKGKPNNLILLKAFPATCRFEEVTTEEYETYTDIINGKKRSKIDDEEFEN